MTPTQRAAHAAVIVTAIALTSTWQPLQALRPTCMEATRPEISRDLEVDDCLLLNRRLIGRQPFVRPPLVIRQTMKREQFGTQSTGSAVWASGIALSRYMELQGSEYWAGKRVVELGCGTGLASITAAELGASVVATDGDVSVVALATENADANLNAKTKRAALTTAVLRWGTPLPAGLLQPDVVIGADLTYSRDAWPALAQTIRTLRAPVLLSVTERRAGEFAALRAFLDAARLRSTVVDSPMEHGYAADNVRLLWIARPRDGEHCKFWVEEEAFGAAESTLGVQCQP